MNIEKLKKGLLGTIYHLGYKIFNKITIFSSFLPLRPKNVIISREKHKPISHISCLVATKRGLYLISKGHITYLLSGEFYGLTTYNNKWYVIQRLGTSSKVITFSIEDSRIINPHRLISGLSSGCHQIDFLDDQLYVTDTYNNRLLVFSFNKGHPYLKDSYYPAGKLSNGRSSSNYVHLNSVWKNKEGLFLLFHNETSKTGRFSEIVLLDSNYSIISKYPTCTSNAHNIFIFKGLFMVCNSMDGTLELGGQVIFKTDKFTRGLSVTDNYLIVGGSNYGKRSERVRLKGAIYFLDENFKLFYSLDMPGMVQEIRTISHKDYCLSNNNL